MVVSLDGTISMVVQDDINDGDINKSPPPPPPPNGWIQRALYHLQNHWEIIALGQLLSFMLAGGGATQATLHFDCDLSSPTFQMATIYLVLSFHLVWIWYQQNRRILFTKTRSTDVDVDIDIDIDIDVQEAKIKIEEEKDGIIKIQKDRHQRQNDTTPANSNSIDTTTASRIPFSIEVEGEQQQQQEPNPWNPLSGKYNHTFFGGRIKLQRPAWKYFLIAFLDVEANAITVLAYRYTTLTSVSLFDALAIPSAMILSRCFFSRRYTFLHYIGVVASMSGVILNVLQDYESDNDSSSNNNPDNSQTTTEDQYYPYKTRGDILAITGGIMYGMLNTLVEMTVRDNGNTTEYLGMLGFFGFFIAFVQSLVLESQDILEFFGRDPDATSTCSLAMGWWLYFTFVGVTLVSYMGASYFLTISEAAYFSLSLLTGDLWSVAFSIVAEKIIPQKLFFLALIFVLSGIVVYEMAPSPVISDHEQQQQDKNHLSVVVVPEEEEDALQEEGHEDDEKGHNTGLSIILPVHSHDS